MTNSRSSLKLTSIESVMPSSHLILCRPLLLLPPIPPSIRVFSNESSLHVGWPKYWSFSFSIIPSKEHITPVHFNHSAYNCEQIKFLLQNIHDNASLNVQLLQKEISETFSKSLPSSTNLETLAEQLANQLSGLNPRRWFQNITHSIGSETIMLIIILVIIFVVYRCLSTKIVQTKQTQLVRAFFTKVSTVTNYAKKKKGELSGDVQLSGIQYVFFLRVLFLKDSLFLISSWKTGMSRTACSSQD